VPIDSASIKCDYNRDYVYAVPEQWIGSATLLRGGHGGIAPGIITVTTDAQVFVFGECNDQGGWTTENDWIDTHGTVPWNERPMPVLSRFLAAGQSVDVGQNSCHEQGVIVISCPTEATTQGLSWKDHI
jgi:hypothetical protein